MDLPAVLQHLRPGSEWTLNGDEYDGLTWLSDDAAPTLAECQAAWKEIERDVLLRPIRAERDRRLAASDWTQIQDAPVDPKIWTAYRQALRDLPATIKDPTAEIKWPEPPK
jgi:hypothetical protein